MPITRPTREEVEALIGRRTPLPTRSGATPVLVAPAAVPAASASASAPRQADFDSVLRPKLRLRKLLEDEEQGMKCGGRVKKMAAGGSVRGDGCCTSGKSKGKFC